MVHIVLRLEADNGIGPYKNNASFFGSSDTPCGRAMCLMPFASSSIEGFQAGRHYCAFRSVEEFLRDWAGADWLDRVKAEGYSVVLYQTKEVLTDNDQAAFVKDEAKCLGRFDPHHLLEVVSYVANS